MTGPSSMMLGEKTMPLFLKAKHYNVLTYRYSTLSLKYDIKNIARLILKSIIFDALEYHISIAGDTLTMRQLYYMKDNNERTRIIMDRLLSSIEAIEQHNSSLYRFTDKEGASLLSSICSMLEVPKNIVEYYISDDSTLKVFEAEWMQAVPDSHFVEGMMFKNSYKEIRRISNRKLAILNEMLKKSP